MLNVNLNDFGLKFEFFAIDWGFDIGEVVSRFARYDIFLVRIALTGEFVDSSTFVVIVCSLTRVVLHEFFL